MALTGRTALISALGALFVGFVLPSWLGALLVQLALLLAILCDLLLAAPVRKLHITRTGDTTVRLTGEASSHLTLTNPSRRTLRATIRDAWPPSSFHPDADTDESRHTLRIPAAERRRLTTTLRPTRRGDHQAVRVTVRSYGPLGLAARQGSRHVPWTLRVLPPFTSRKHLPAKLARLRELDGRTSILTRGEGTEFDSLRDYTPGDDTRSIDWRATARRQTLAVRTWRPERDRRILLVLETGRTSAGRVGDIPRLDASMDAALLLGALAARAGDRVDLLAYDRRIRASVQGRTARDLLPALTDALAPLESELVEADARGLAATIHRHTPRRSLIVLFTGLDAAPVEEALLPVLPGLTQRNELIVAAVADPRIEEMAAGRHTPQAVYEAAAAEQAHAARRRTADRLRHHGITVIDSTPARLAPDLADAYLTLKSTGRL
ncbi:DUF58 domain-containing protein [Streptomyces sp. DSM 41527]|uniref:DUF58 domain-containing protein n=1 Tax=Streptomyces mooreae TaxID=3075523 RepID=A0ABU2TBN1_9ACTN|nr:DUF58 domain-containing protein [Streptomyces sp. DSM 41527]MDT0458343.1 DUF58 domain-containing protein [Streptomyces sp. DSM 41527]